MKSIHTHIHTHTHTYIHIYTHIHIQTHTHTIYNLRSIFYTLEMNNLTI